MPLGPCRSAHATHAARHIPPGLCHHTTRAQVAKPAGPFEPRHLIPCRPMARGPSRPGAYTYSASRGYAQSCSIELSSTALREQWTATRRACTMVRDRTTVSSAAAVSLLHHCAAQHQSDMYFSHLLFGRPIDIFRHSQLFVGFRSVRVGGGLCRVVITV